MARKPDVQYVRFVTDGSAARVAEWLPVKAKTRLPKIKKRKAKASAIYLDPLAFVGILLSCVMLVLMVVMAILLGFMKPLGMAIVTVICVLAQVVLVVCSHIFIEKILHKAE